MVLAAARAAAALHSAALERAQLAVADLEIWRKYAAAKAEINRQMSIDHTALLNAVRRGDMLLLNCWYHNTGAEKIKKLYEEATSGTSSDP